MRTNLKRCEKRSKDTPTKPSTILKPRVKHLTFFLGVGIAFDVHSRHSWQLNSWILKLGVLPLHSPNSKHQQIPGIGGFGGFKKLQGTQDVPRYIQKPRFCWVLTSLLTWHDLPRLSLILSSAPQGSYQFGFLVEKIGETTSTIGQVSQTSQRIPKLSRITVVVKIVKSEEDRWSFFVWMQLFRGCETTL